MVMENQISKNVCGQPQTENGGNKKATKEFGRFKSLLDTEVLSLSLSKRLSHGEVVQFVQRWKCLPDGDEKRAKSDIAVRIAEQMINDFPFADWDGDRVNQFPFASWDRNRSDSELKNFQDPFSLIRAAMLLVEMAPDSKKKEFLLKIVASRFGEESSLFELNCRCGGDFTHMIDTIKIFPTWLRESILDAMEARIIKASVELDAGFFVKNGFLKSAQEFPPERRWQLCDKIVARIDRDILNNPGWFDATALVFAENAVFKAEKKMTPFQKQISCLLIGMGPSDEGRFKASEKLREFENLRKILLGWNNEKKIILGD